jgi:curli biogenesis system outer membrane secretion channel CsgG
MFNQRSVVSRFRGTGMTLAFVLLAGSVFGGQAFRLDEAPASPQPVLSKPIRPIPGPKRTVAVASFTLKSDFQARYGLTDAGGGLAAMLATALVESERFLLVERPELTQVFSEQQLGSAGLVSGESAARPGALLGAQLLLLASLSEYQEGTSGKGFSIGLAGLGGSPFGIGLSPQSRKVSIGIDVRVVDSTSAQVVAAYRVTESFKSKSLGLNLAVRGVSLGQTGFQSTPLGQASRTLIQKLVERFAEEAARAPWAGLVVDVEGGELAINAGSIAGIEVGDRFEVQRTTELLTDPATGLVLGRRTASLGTMAVARLEEHLAFGPFEAAGELAPLRSDLVVQVGL